MLPPLGGPLYRAAVLAGHDPAHTLSVLATALEPTSRPLPVPGTPLHSVTAPQLQEPS
ncbi:hypothetical protein [Deinococcus sp. KSM4-11]|uniref:hypothetical protein n=1 Tax=Deinococcus sp. KSM4-11 TaxID=2568654 RepID=UPI001454DED9|nr:hypothetical protein [Deinococcus sp. KSM4-11]